MPDVAIFLQNAWSPYYAGREWPRESWLEALAGSRSGERLAVFDELDPWYDNTTPICGGHPGSVVPPDPEHVRRVLADVGPLVVVACGRQAERVLIREWSGPLLVIPHPAHRLVTNALYRCAADLLKREFRSRAALRQLRGRCALEYL